MLGNIWTRVSLQDCPRLWPGKSHPASRRQGQEVRVDLATLLCPSSSHPPRPRSQRPPSPGLLSQSPAVSRFLPSPQASIPTRNGQVSHCSVGWLSSMTLILRNQNTPPTPFSGVRSSDNFALRCDAGHSMVSPWKILLKSRGLSEDTCGASWPPLG